MKGKEIPNHEVKISPSQAEKNRAAYAAKLRIYFYCFSIIKKIIIIIIIYIITVFFTIFLCLLIFTFFYRQIKAAKL